MKKTYDKAKNFVKTALKKEKPAAKAQQSDEETLTKEEPKKEPSETPPTAAKKPSPIKNPFGFEIPNDPKSSDSSPDSLQIYVDPIIPANPTNPTSEELPWCVKTSVTEIEELEEEDSETGLITRMSRKNLSNFGQETQTPPPMEDTKLRENPSRCEEDMTLKKEEPKKEPSETPPTAAKKPSPRRNSFGFVIPDGPKPSNSSMEPLNPMIKGAPANPTSATLPWSVITSVTEIEELEEEDSEAGLISRMSRKNPSNFGQETQTPPPMEDMKIGENPYPSRGKEQEVEIPESSSSQRCEKLEKDAVEILEAEKNKLTQRIRNVTGNLFSQVREKLEEEIVEMLVETTASSNARQMAANKIIEELEEKTLKLQLASEIQLVYIGSMMTDIKRAELEMQRKLDRSFMQLTNWVEETKAEVLTSPP